MGDKIYAMLEQAIAELTAAPSNEKMFMVLQLLGDLMSADGEVLVPADKVPNLTGEGEDDRIQFRLLQAGDGTALLVCFTSQAQMELGESTNAVNLPFMQVLMTALSSEQEVGIVINPWGKPFRLNRQLMEILAQMCEEEEDEGQMQLCKADNVPDEFVVQLRNAGVLLPDIRCIAIAGLIRQGEGSFLLLVECEPLADQAKTFERLQSHLLPTVLPVDVAPLEGEVPEFARVIYRKLD